MKVAHNLKFRRRESNITQKDLAKISGVSIECIGKIERGEITNIRLNTLCKISSALNIPLISLLNTESSSSPIQNSCVEKGNDDAN